MSVSIEALKTPNATQNTFMLALCYLIDVIKNVGNVHAQGPAVHKLYNVWLSTKPKDNNPETFATWVSKHAKEFAEDVNIMRSSSAKRFSVPPDNEIDHMIGSKNGVDATEYILQLGKSIGQALNEYRRNRKFKDAADFIGTCKEETPVKKQLAAQAA